MEENRTIEELVARAAADLISAKYAIALTGAGISTESGIPDYRGPDGAWTKDPQAERAEPVKASQSYQNFLENPKKWWTERLSDSKSLTDYRDKALPNAGHCALVELEKLGVLQYVITSNVDGLHEKAGAQCLLEYHGNFAKLRCISCGARYNKDEFDLQTMLREDKLPPRCPECRGVIKPDGVSFGEAIPDDVAQQSFWLSSSCDLMLICGTSAAVYPFASLPGAAKEHGAVIIEINAEPTRLTTEGISSYLIRGKTGDILPKIVEKVRMALKSENGTPK